MFEKINSMIMSTLGTVGDLRDRIPVINVAKSFSVPGCSLRNDVHDPLMSGLSADSGAGGRNSRVHSGISGL